MALTCRLKTLERLHVDAATFGVRLVELEDQCRAIQERVESNAVVLREVKEGMEANMITMLENIKSVRFYHCYSHLSAFDFINFVFLIQVDSRINALKAKEKA
jgi:hypothetical protein